MGSEVICFPTYRYNDIGSRRFENQEELDASTRTGENWWDNPDKIGVTEPYKAPEVEKQKVEVHVVAKTEVVESADTPVEVSEPAEAPVPVEVEYDIPTEPTTASVPEVPGLPSICYEMTNKQLVGYALDTFGEKIEGNKAELYDQIAGLASTSE